MWWIVQVSRSRLVAFPDPGRIFQGRCGTPCGTFSHPYARYLVLCRAQKLRGSYVGQFKGV